MSTIITIIVTLLMLGVLVLVHEGGHYLVARACKVGIMEFSIGFGPVLYKKKGKYNDFSIRALPIGGYVSMIGEEDGQEIPEEHRGKPSLNDKKTWQKIAIVLAGPFMNILLGVLIMAGLVVATDIIPSTTVAVLVDQQINEQTGLPVNQSGKYGLQVGDEITEIDGASVNVYYDMSYLISSRGNEPVDVTVIRNGEEIVLEDVVFPVIDQRGVEMGAIDFQVYRKDKTFGSVCYEAFWQPVSTVRTTVMSLVDTFSGRFGLAGVSGVVGMGEVMNEVIDSGRSFGEIFISLLNMTVLISLSLGICNLIPIPALDGGRFVIYAIEGVIRRKLPPKAVNIAIGVSMTLLLAFMAFITLKDIINLF